jgi:hypothetical protein
MVTLWAYVSRTGHATTATWYAAHGRERILNKKHNMQAGTAWPRSWSFVGRWDRVRRHCLYPVRRRHCAVIVARCLPALVGWPVGLVGWGHVEMGVAAFSHPDQASWVGRPMDSVV